MKSAAFELVPVGEKPLRFKEIGGDVSAMMRLYTTSAEKSSDVVDPRVRASALCDMRSYDEMVIDNHRHAIKRKRRILNLSDKGFAKGSKKSRLEYQRELDALVRKTEKIERNTLLTMESKFLEPSKECFKCDVAYCHNRLKGNKIVQDNMAILLKSLRNKFSGQSSSSPLG